MAHLIKPEWKCVGCCANRCCTLDGVEKWRKKRRSIEFSWCGFVFVFVCNGCFTGPLAVRQRSPYEKSARSVVSVSSRIRLSLVSGSVSIGRPSRPITDRRYRPLPAIAQVRSPPLTNLSKRPVNTAWNRLFKKNGATFSRYLVPNVIFIIFTCFLLKWNVGQSFNFDESMYFRSCLMAEIDFEFGREMKWNWGRKTGHFR